MKTLKAIGSLRDGQDVSCSSSDPTRGIYFLEIVGAGTIHVCPAGGGTTLVDGEARDMSQPGSDEPDEIYIIEDGPNGSFEGEGLWLAIDADTAAVASPHRGVNVEVTGGDPNAGPDSSTQRIEFEVAEQPPASGIRARLVAAVKRVGTSR